MTAFRTGRGTIPLGFRLIVMTVAMLVGSGFLPAKEAQAAESCEQLDSQAAGLQPGSPNFDDLTDRRLASGCAAYQITNDPNSILYLRGLNDNSAVFIGRTGVSLLGDIALTDLGQLYGVQASDFYRIDRRSGIATYIGAVGFSVNGLVVAADGTVYGSGSGLVRIDPATGRGTLVGTFGGGLQSSGDLAFLNGTLYATLMGSGSDQLGTINIATGVASVRGSIGSSDVFGLVGVNGGLIGGTSTGQLLSISPTSGAGTVIASSGPGLGGLAGAPNASGSTTCPGQYRVQYFNNTILGGTPTITTCEGWPIDHDWAGGGPGGGVANDNFSARWTGRARIEAGNYYFRATADDGFRAWLDGSLIIDEWRDQGATDFSVTRSVSAGDHDIKIEYYERAGAAVAKFRWELVPSQAPANDMFASATAISGGAAGLTGSTINATKEPGEPNHAGYIGGHSIWYRYVAPSAGTATFNTLGSSFDTLLAVYTGPSVSSLSLVTQNDDVDGGAQSRVGPFTVAGGTTYYVAIDGYAGATGTTSLGWLFESSAPAAPSNLLATVQGPTTVRLTWQDNSSNEDGFWLFINGAYTAPNLGANSTSRDVGGLQASTRYCFRVQAFNGTGGGGATAEMCATTTAPAPSNDSFGSATTLSGNSGVSNGTTVNATKQSGEPNHAGYIGGHSIWYRYVASSAGTATFDTLGSAFDTLLAVYTGPSVSSLTLVGQNDDVDGGAQSRVGPFSVVGGTTYYVAIDGYANASGTTKLNWSFVPTVTTVPAAPSNPAAVAVDGTSIRISWTDTSDNEAGFEINNSGPSRTAGVNATSYIWSGLAPGTYMCFRVRSYNSAGSSGFVPSTSPYYVCATTPIPASARLAVPFATQMGTAGNPNNGGNNCGPASVTMGIRFYGGSASVQDSAIAIRGTNDSTNGPTDFKSTATLDWLGRYSLTEKSVSTYDQVRGELAAGRPVIILVNNNQYRYANPQPYPSDSSGWFTTSHIVVVTGYDTTSVYVNDPLRSAGDYAMPIAAFKSAASTTPSTTATNWYAASILRR